MNGNPRRPSWRPPRRTPRGDLHGVPFPLGDWGHPAARLDELYRWAEDGAIRTIEWYLGDRLWKRRVARVLRAGAVLGTAAGVGLPLLGLADGQPGLARWGYVWLLVAVACVGIDRWFGLTSGWMRDVATAQAVQRRLEALRFDWASESVREVLGPTEGTASEAAERCLAVLRRFCEDVSELVRDETMDWMVEFRAGPAPLHTQALVGWGRHCDGGQQQHRFPLPPGNRPNMPRQRPPEGPGR
ncbi:SLATT domain-containing protein [Streptomyces sp. RB6PN25]|uniref:SLATT domain-containing protein n=1 Tax=Streptomyces humicola TaxID=2953240 RepID=A0ABT1PXC5_9ACTN|nr:SLATT domain-containing protein [Streptomyces humicola]MCQ4081640.1 SLATT domain-containing protein [Streptomyces humicola]